MRGICALVSTLVMALAAAPAAAQPVSFQIKADVPAGKRPLLRVRADQAIKDLRVELERDDGKRFSSRRGRLARGQTASFPIGDGAAGRARYSGTISARIGDRRWSRELTFETLVRGSVTISYDLDHLYLDRCVLEFKVSRPAASAELEVFGEDGTEIGSGSARYQNKPPGTWLPIKWRQPRGKRVMKMRLRVVADNGLTSTVELFPWSVRVDHEDVNFPTGSAEIRPGERDKLDDSLAKIRAIVKRSGRFMKMKLYIAGHTDTVGSAADNRRLSRDRARAIARYFRRKGLSIPIAVAGFGEQVLAVKTPDNTDNAANRRADYVLGPAGGAPPFKGAYRAVRAGWKELR
jgi:outer membrane protein OmpA-like peptidoglycan-associated protein